MLISPTKDRRRQILILGGGPAGSSAAIRLARAGLEVTLIEKAAFPRPKLCGEFISPECLKHFDALDVSADIMSGGGASIRETVFYDRRGRSIAVPSRWFAGSENALSLSRAQLDAHLLNAAGRAGAEVFTETTATRVTMRGREIEAVHVRNAAGDSHELRADLYIDATGRSAVLGKLVARALPGKDDRSQAKPKLVAFKAHLRAPGVDRSRCEIYSFTGGYGGLSPVEGGLANLCIVVDSETARAFKSDIQMLAEKVVSVNPQARESLRNAEMVGEALAVAIQSFGKKALKAADNAFSVGDAAGFIDPFTGSGILMSLEGSEILASAIIEGRAGILAVSAKYESEFDRRFANRLRLCRILRLAAFRPRLATAAIVLLGASKIAREIVAKRTRGEYIGEN